MQFKVSHLPISLNNGYECVRIPHHPSARSNGYVYLHRVLMENKLGRFLSREEHVHHKDGNRRNNKISNLKLMTAKDHAHLHRGRIEDIKCQSCSKKFTPSTRRVKTCSVKCGREAQERGPWPSDSDLAALLWSEPATVIAKRVGVSSSAVKKRCKLRGISTPPRGYWTGKS